MKLFVLSLALSMTAAAASAQSALPTPPVTAPPSDANHLSTQGIDTAHPELQSRSAKACRRWYCRKHTSGRRPRANSSNPASKTD